MVPSKIPSKYIKQKLAGEFHENHSLPKKEIADFNNMHILFKYLWILYKDIGYNKTK